MSIAAASFVYGSELCAAWLFETVFFFPTLLCSTCKSGKSSFNKQSKTKQNKNAEWNTPLSDKRRQIHIINIRTRDFCYAVADSSAIDAYCYIQDVIFRAQTCASPSSMNQLKFWHVQKCHRSNAWPPENARWLFTPNWGTCLYYISVVVVAVHRWMMCGSQTDLSSSVLFVYEVGGFIFIGFYIA